VQLLGKVDFIAVMLVWNSFILYVYVCYEQNLCVEVGETYEKIFWQSKSKKGEVPYGKVVKNL
jgi:hypothetical protein